MWDITFTSALTTIFSSFVSLFKLTKLPIACKSFYISKNVPRQELRMVDTTLNPSCGWRHNSKPDASKHPFLKSNHDSDTICWEIKRIWSFYQEDIKYIVEHNSNPKV